MLVLSTARQAYERLKSEITRSPVDVEIPGEGAMEASAARGDLFLHDPADDGMEKGAFAWISAEPSWQQPTMLYAVHIWGPSERHLDILIDVCQYGVDAGIGDLPISYRRGGHPLTIIADQYANVKFSSDGKHSETTLRRALVTLKKVRR